MPQDNTLDLFLLPGLLCDETVWQPQAEALKDLCNPVIVTYHDARSMAEMAARILAKAPPRFALAGHSMGGRVAMEVYAELDRRGEADRIAGIALLDTAAGPPAEGEVAKRQPLVDRARVKGMDVLIADWLPPMVHPGRLNDRSLMDPLKAMVRRRSPEEFAGQINALLTRPDARPVLERITCPSLMLCGRQDAWRTVEEHEAMARLIPGVTFEVVEDCGHMATVEQPDAVTAALARWLADIHRAGKAN